MMQLAAPKQNSFQKRVVQLDTQASERRGSHFLLRAYSGRGSAILRSGEIRRIYEDSAPPINSAMKPSARAFLTEVIGIVKNGVEQTGGTFDVPKAA